MHAKTPKAKLCEESWGEVCCVSNLTWTSFEARVIKELQLHQNKVVLRCTSVANPKLEQFHWMFLLESHNKFKQSITFGNLYFSKTASTKESRRHQQSPLSTFKGKRKVYLNGLLRASNLLWTENVWKLGIFLFYTELMSWM